MAEQPITKFVRTDLNCAVETGTWHGDTTGLLASFPNFEEIHSIELSPQLYEAASRRFASESRVHLWLGDSGERLAEMLAELEEYVEQPRALVYLDGHYSGGDTARADLASPLRRELETLVEFRHLVKSVLIDDVAVCFAVENGEGDPLYVEGFPPIAEVYEYLRRIDPGFEVVVDHESRPLSILVAHGDRRDA